MDIHNKFFLRAESKEALFAALVLAGIAIPNPPDADRPYSYAPGFDVDEAGVFSIGGQFDPETGEVIEEPTILDGYHCNGIGALTDDQRAILADMLIAEPKKRLRYWAGEQIIEMPPEPEPAPAEEPNGEE